MDCVELHWRQRVEVDGDVPRGHACVLPRKAYREFAGEAGRRAHRAFPVPLYEYEKGRTQAAKEAMAKALTGQVPVVEQEKAMNVDLPPLPRETDNDAGTVDNMQAGGHFARWGEVAAEKPWRRKTGLCWIALNRAGSHWTALDCAGPH